MKLQVEFEEDEWQKNSFLAVKARNQAQTIAPTLFDYRNMGILWTA